LLGTHGKEQGLGLTVQNIGHARVRGAASAVVGHKEAFADKVVLVFVGAHRYQAGRFPVEGIVKANALRVGLLNELAQYGVSQKYRLSLAGVGYPVSLGHGSPLSQCDFVAFTTVEWHKKIDFKLNKKKVGLDAWTKYRVLAE
jgi:hypothetical protein